MFLLKKTSSVRIVKAMNEQRTMQTRDNQDKSDQPVNTIALIEPKKLLRYDNFFK